MKVPLKPDEGIAYRNPNRAACPARTTLLLSAPSPAQNLAEQPSPIWCVQALKKIAPNAPRQGAGLKFGRRLGLPVRCTGLWLAELRTSVFRWLRPGAG